MIVLKSIQIKGFKSISEKKPVSLALGRVNVILGANGAGKSNIISFFKMLNFMMSGSLQNFVEANGSGQNFLHYGPKITRQIVGKLELENDEFNDNYDFTLYYANPDRLIVSSEEVTYYRKKERKPNPRKLDVEYKESVLSQRSNDESLKIIHRMLSRCKVYQFHDTSAESSMRRANSKDFNNYLQAEGGNVAAFLYRIRDEFPQDYVRIVRYVQSVVPLFKDFVLEPNSYGNIMLQWRDNSATDYILNPNQFSDGSLRFIALATLLLQPKRTMPYVIIIDEPELGLHPIAISQLAEMIKEASINAQIIIATQSPYLIDEFEAKEIVVIESEKDDNGRYNTISKRLDEKELEGWLEEYTLSELWDKNIIGGRPEWK